MSTYINTQQSDKDTSISAAIAEAHNVIYSTEETVFGNLFDNTNTKSQQLKRKHNESGNEIETVVNAKQSEEQKSKRAKHKKPTPNDDNTSPPHTIVTEATVHVESSLSPDILMVTQLINKLSIDMRSMFSNVTTRIDDLETNLERKITHKVSQMVDKRINSEVTKVRKDVNSVVENLRADIDNDLKSVEDKLDEISEKIESTESADKDLSYNIVIRNLPESVNENLKVKVSALIREGLKLNGVSICKAVRKQSRSVHVSGVVIATFNSKENIRDVMAAKQKLKESRQYSNVYIQKDLTLQQRMERKNFKTIVDVLKSVNPNIDMKGAEIVAHRYVNHQSGNNNRVRDNRHQHVSASDDGNRRNENQYNENRRSVRHDHTDNRRDFSDRREHQTDRRHGNREGQHRQSTR